MVSLIRKTQPVTSPGLSGDLPDSRPRQVVGQYRLLAELARGGMGRVYLARRSGQAGFERHFAIKVMNQQLSDDNDARLMLLDEAHIASRLHHPNVVSVLDIGSYDEGYYLVMDYVEGCSLQQLLRRSPENRPPRLIVPIILDALHGLHAVHTLRNPNGQPYGVVHRDISPHNLMVGADGGCRVTDFGIAKARERFSDTEVGVFKGKLAFMAPEQLRDMNNLDARVDVWASGVTLYVALTGEHPLRAENDATTVHNILLGEIKPPSQVGLKPPACLDAVLMRALERDPERRFQSAHEFGEALRKVAMAEDLLGSPSEVAEWVDQVCGADLAERRRRIAELPREDEGMTTTASVPRLWFSGESGVQVGATPPHATRAEAISSSTGVTRALDGKPRSPRRLAAVLVVAAAVVAGGLAALLGSSSHEEAKKPVATAVELPHATPQPPTVAAAPAAAPGALSPTVAEPTVPAASPADEVASPEREALPGASHRARPAQWKRRVDTKIGAATSAAPASAAPASAEPAPQEPPKESGADSPPARRIERNPYVFGE